MITVDVLTRAERHEVLKAVLEHVTGGYVDTKRFTRRKREIFTALVEQYQNGSEDYQKGMRDFAKLFE